MENGSTTAKDGLLCITKQLTWPSAAQPSIAQPGSPPAPSSEKLASVAVMVLILTVTQWTIVLDLSIFKRCIHM